MVINWLSSVPNTINSVFGFVYDLKVVCECGLR